MKFFTTLSQNTLFTWLFYVLTKAVVIGTIMAVTYHILGRTSTGFKNWVKRMLSDNGEPSFSRTATAFLVLLCGFTDVYLAYRNGAFPDVTGQIGLIGALYGLNVGGNALSKFAGRPAAAIPNVPPIIPPAVAINVPPQPAPPQPVASQPQ